MTQRIRPEGWYPDPDERYHSRWYDERGGWTGWVTTRLWDPRGGGLPGARSVLRGYWATLLWLGDRVTITQHADHGGHLDVPARSCVPVAVDELRHPGGGIDLGLQLTIELGARPVASTYAQVLLLFPPQCRAGLDDFVEGLRQLTEDVSPSIPEQDSVSWLSFRPLPGSADILPPGD